MINVKLILVNFEGLVKNRQGPYHIVLKNEDGEYITLFSKWTLDKSFAHKYDLYSCILSALHRNDEMNDNPLHNGKKGVFYLTTAAGDIGLSSEKDFK